MNLKMINTRIVKKYIGERRINILDFNKNKDYKQNIKDIKNLTN